jgi:hypothetical protein
MQLMAQAAGHAGHGQAESEPPSVAPNATSVPGFPQDAFMEMPMDAAVDKPETYGLPRNWTAGMMGMMTLVRVLPPDLYDRIMAMKAGQAPQQPPPAHHPHG